MADEKPGMWKEVNDDLTPIARIQQNLAKANWSYLCKHPEIRAIIRVLLQKAIDDQPQNLNNYLADLFNCTKTPEIINMINKQLKCVKELLKKGHWTPYDGQMLFTESISSTSIPQEEQSSASTILSLSVISQSGECEEF